MTIGLFGGSFNPPHIAHLAVAQACAEGADLDTVLWMPTPDPPHKQSARLVAAEHRLEMAWLAITGNARFAVSDAEFQRPGPHYTVDTLRVLRGAHPEADLALVIGGDSLASFASWREPETILDLARLVVYRRPGSDLSGIAPDVMARVTLVDGPALDLSATEIRARLGAGQTVRYLVPDAIRDYIEARGLYAAPR